MFDIIPGILETEWSEIEKKLNIVQEFASTVHIDVIDGKFINNTTFLDPQPFQQFSKRLFLEAHLMVEDPITYLQPFADAGFKRFLGHIEKMPDQIAFVTKGQELGEVGLAIDGPTEVDKIKVHFTDLDSILFYTGKQVGFSGAALLPERLEKVRKYRKQTDELIPIQADGGINAETIVDAYHAGVTRFISTGYLFTGNTKDNYFTLINLLSEHS